MTKFIDKAGLRAALVKVKEYIDGLSTKISNIENTRPEAVVYNTSNVNINGRWGNVYICNSVSEITISVENDPSDKYEMTKDITIRWNTASVPNITLNGNKFVWEYGEQPEFSKMGEINIAYAGNVYYCVAASFSS